MKKTGSIGIINNEVLSQKEDGRYWFYLNTIKETGDPNCWDLKYEYFDGKDETTTFECVVLLTDERIKPKRLLHRRLGSFSNKIENKDWFRKALVSINGARPRTEYIAENGFRNFVWEDNRKDLQRLFRNPLQS